ncbi:DUF6676 family protein [Gordonia sp. VNK21]|uniref:Rv1476 family membrane protein n=1 Tax=Gordonia sp. VNK21 TaxID=3382483 RepID=UPI0038D3844D
MTPGPATFTLAAPADTTGQWKHLDLPAIAAQLEQTGVSAPAGDVPGLEKIVAQADADGHDLHVVVLEESFSPFTVYRDIATQLQEQTGGTVLVFGPGSVGTASDDFSRVQLEDGTSGVTTMSNPVAATQEIYDRATDPYVNWTVITVVMIVVVLVGAVLARLIMLRARRDDPAQTEAAESDAAAPHGADGEAGDGTAAQADAKASSTPAS